MQKIENISSNAHRGAANITKLLESIDEQGRAGPNEGYTPTEILLKATWFE